MQQQHVAKYSEQTNIQGEKYGSHMELLQIIIIVVNVLQI